MAQNGQVLWRVAYPDAGLIFSKGNIKDPMDTILNPPMGPDRVGELFHLIGEASKVIALLDRHLPIEMALRFDHPQREQLGPGVLLHEPHRSFQGPVSANLHAPMLLRLRLIGLQLCLLTSSAEGR